MTGVLAVGDRVRLTGGYDHLPDWLEGKTARLGAVESFIPRHDATPVAIVKLDEPATVSGITGEYVILGLRYVGAEWAASETVHVELCDFVPEALRWQDGQRGKWVESHATYARL